MVARASLIRSFMSGIQPDAGSAGTLASVVTVPTQVRCPPARSAGLNSPLGRVSSTVERLMTFNVHIAHEEASFP